MAAVPETKEALMVKPSKIRKDSPRARSAKGTATGKSAKKPRRSATSKSVSSKKANGGVRTGTKQAILIEMLKRPKGVTIAEMATKTGWQAHSVRGAISGTLKKKLGLAVTSERVGDGPRRYRIQVGQG
jgi:hypothetical protein